MPIVRILGSQEQINVYLAGDQHRFNHHREEQFIYLNGNFSDNKIPNIICAKCAADTKDKYSDFGFIIHEWNEKTGQVDIERYKYDLKKDQDDFDCQTIENLYCMKRVKKHNKREVEKATKEFSKFSVLLKKYENYIEKQCAEIELNGLPTNEEDLRRSYKLDSIFVPLSFSLEHDWNVRSVYEQLELELFRGPESNIESKTQIDEILRNYTTNFNNDLSNNYYNIHRHISLDDLIPAEGIFRGLILADPGAGKTTLLKYIATHYCSHKNYAEKGNKLTVRKLFPIWIRCRDIKGDHISITEIINNIPRLAEWGLNDSDLSTFSEMVRNQIDCGNALLLIDGLDEIISERDRRDFVEQLNRFVENNKSVNIIISSRKKGFSIVSNRVFSDYVHLEINPLNKRDIKDLCMRWNSLVYRNIMEGVEEANKLSETIIHDERLFRLAKNPLMLTTLLLVKRRLGNLPTKRAGLYYEAVQVLLETWNSEQHERIDLDESMYQLAYIAFWMSTNKDKGISYSRGRITKTNLLDLLNEFRQRFPHLIYSNSLTPSDFINIVERRSALLIRTGVEAATDGHEEPIYEFQHLTFQEYLAAYSVCKCCYPNADPNDRDGQVLIPYFTDTNMKEIIQLAASIEPYCANKLSQEALKLFAETNSSKDWLNIRNLLLQFIADEIAISPQAVYTILEKCFEEGIWSTDNSIMKLIVEGKNGPIFQKFLEDSDNKYCQGYPHFSPIYRHLSGEVFSIDEYLAMIDSTDPKLIVEGLSLLNSFNLANENRLRIQYNDQISSKVYSLLDSDNERVSEEALITVYFLDIVGSTEQFVKYVNAVINAINRDHLPSIMDVTDFHISKINHIPANTIVQLNEKGMARILRCLKDIRFNSIEEYEKKVSLLAYASFGNAEIDQLKKAYELVAEFRKNIKSKDSYLKEKKIFKCFGELLNKFEGLSGEISDLFVQYGPDITGAGA